jgi:hypothetical protein
MINFTTQDKYYMLNNNNNIIIIIYILLYKYIYLKVNCEYDKILYCILGIVGKTNNRDSIYTYHTIRHTHILCTYSII